MKNLKKSIVVVLIATTPLFAVEDYTSSTPATTTDIASYEVVQTEITTVSPFCLAIAKGEYDTVKRMIELGTNVNKLSNDMSPLMYAARYNNVRIMKLLIANGAELKKRNSKKKTALNIAKQSNATDAVSLLENL
ncbi:hypothetical protein GCM10009117_23610 [Gangjinia marincola]|uniref:Ankyrin repeat domain-containing protein n=1 Tax=Gangjinia marincola TaxID=578463 RepID=A0ABP3XUY4_9FLAO